MEPSGGIDVGITESRELMGMGGGWVLEVAIRSFLDELDHGHLRIFLDRGLRDGVIRRAIGKWLQAGVLERGALEASGHGGLRKGGVISYGRPGGARRGERLPRVRAPGATGCSTTPIAG